MSGPQTPDRAPSFAAVEEAVRAAVARGWTALADARGYCSSVAALECDGFELVVKSPVSRHPAFVWRRMIRHEHRVYDRLAGMQGVPRCHGLVDGRYLVLERVAGTSLRSAELRDPERFHARLRALVERLHERGVAHADLKKKENLLVTPDGDPIALDFATAVVRKPGFAPLNHLLWRAARQLDLNAWLKHKYGRDLAGMSPEDARFYRLTPAERVSRFLRLRVFRHTAPRHRQTTAARSPAAGDGGPWVRWRRSRQAARAWRRARRATPLAWDEPVYLRSIVDGAWLVASPDGSLGGSERASEATLFRLQPAGDEGVEPPGYSRIVEVREDGSERRICETGRDGDPLFLRAAGEPGGGDSFKIFDPSSRADRGEALRPGLPVAFTSRDELRRWLYELDRGGRFVSSQRFLRPWSTFHLVRPAERPDPSA